MQTLTRTKIALCALAIFVAGTVTGAAFLLVPGGWRGAGRPPHRPPPGEMAAHIRAHLRGELALTPEQEGKIAPIIDGEMAALGALRRESSARIRSLVEEIHARVASELTPEQRVKYEELLRRRRARHQRERGGH